MAGKSGKKIAPRSTNRGEVVAAQGHYQIGDARRNLSYLVGMVESSDATFTVGKRSNPSAVLVSYLRIKPLLEKRIEQKLALAIVEQLLRDAPLHLRAPAVEELSRLSRKDLVVLVEVDTLSLSDQEKQRIQRRLSEPRALERLVQRFELARVISQAREAGLYEEAEHAASQVVKNTRASTPGRKRAISA